MLDKKKRNPEFQKLFKLYEFNTKVTLIFSYRQAPEGYDPYEAAEEEYDLNPRTIKAYVIDVTPEAMTYKLQGMAVRGAKEIICDAKYYEWFKICAKVKIDDQEYQVFRLGSASNSTVTKRPFNIMKAYVVQKKVE